MDELSSSGKSKLSIPTEHRNSELCARCDGHCCKFTIFLQKEDIYDLILAGKSKFVDPTDKDTEDHIAAGLLLQLGGLAQMVPDSVKSEISSQIKKSLGDVHETIPEFALKKKEDGLCIFHDVRENGTGFCTVYESRPKVCREYHTDRCVDFRNLIIPEQRTST